MNKQILYLAFAFVLTFSAGAYLGSRFEVKNQTNTKRQKIKHKALSTKAQLTAQKSTVQKDANKDKNLSQVEEVASDCYYDSDFDAQAFNELYEEEEVKWDQSLKELFTEKTAYPERMLEDYKKLKIQRDQAHQKVWEKNKERSKINDKTYGYFPSWEEDQERFAIDRKFHEDLKKFLGENLYQKYQQKINAQYEIQIKKARNGEPYVSGFDY